MYLSQMKIYSVLYNDFHPLSTFFPEYETKVVTSPEDIDGPGILILHGGADIHNSLYNKGRSYMSDVYSKTPTPRDQLEWACIQRAKELNVLIFGICRGAQMLCAAAGGILVQHVDNHAGEDHMMTTADGKQVRINSYHHQMAYPFDVEHKLLGWSTEQRSQRYFDDEDMMLVPKEVEAVYYPKIHGFGVQWHPEWMYADEPASQWIQEQLNVLIRPR